MLLGRPYPNRFRIPRSRLEKALSISIVLLARKRVGDILILKVKDFFLEENIAPGCVTKRRNLVRACEYCAKCLNTSIESDSMDTAEV